jgi:subtilisin family serine protease
MVMRIRQLMIAVVVVAMGCQQGSKSEESVATPARSDKLIRVADPVPGSYLVALAGGIGEAEAVTLAQRHGATLTRYLPPPVNAALLTLEPSKAIALAEDAAVKFAEEDQVLHVASVEWNLDRIDQRATGGDGSYTHATTGAGVNVYVLDSGVLATHPELVGRASQVADFVHRAPAGTDCSGHGTHVAGVVAGTNVGVAPGATILAVKVADCDGTAEASDLLEALDWVRVNQTTPAVVLVGTTGGPSTVLAATVDALVQGGVAVVGPAGNDGGDACATALGAVPSVITVGATSAMDVPLASSNRGRCVALYAPGAAIRSGWNDGGLRLADGTSQAAAHVAGAAALFLEARPGATAARVADALVGNATVGAVKGVPLGSPDRLLFTGFITPALGADATAPDVSITAPTAVSGDVAVVMTTSATDVVSAALYVDGSWVGSDATPADGLSIQWKTVPYANGQHVVEARVYDAAGNVGTAQATVTVENAGNAAWDPDLQAPVCATASERCSSGSLLAGRGPVGPEAHAPNTLQALCGDGAGGTYHVDESVEAIAVQAAIPGHPLVEGDLVNVDVTVWAYPDFGGDRVDLHFARDAGAPAWELVGTRSLTGAGLQTVRFTYRLPAFPDAPQRPQQAVRATVRYGGAAATCSDGPYDDHDDLAFAVGAGAPDTVKPMVAVVAPDANREVSGLVNLDATAEDVGGGAIGRVELYVDGALVGTAMERTGSVYRVTWLADAVTVADHTVVAVAWDASGNSAASDPVTVAVKDLSAPTVAIEAPRPGIAVGGIVRLWAVVDDNRTIQKVELMVGSTVVGTVLTPPWAFDWDSTTTAAKQVTISAVAYDGVTSTASAPVTVRIDKQQPIVAIDFPKATTPSVQGVTDVQITASDDDVVERVELYAGGTFVDTGARVGTSDLWVVHWNTGLLQNGPVTLTAKAYDAAGNSATSDPVAVVVNDTTPPFVVFVDPKVDALVRGAVPLVATATDNGVVTHVRFEAGSTIIVDDAFEPYGGSWNTTSLPDGPVTLLASAFDVAGLSSTASRTVRVDNHGPAVTIVPPAGPVSGVVTIAASATDLYGVDRVDLWAGSLYLGEMQRAAGTTSSYTFTWSTTEFDNAVFSLTAVAMDVIGNVSQSAAVAFDVSNLTTAERDATLGVPACAASAAWCFSGTLLQGAGDFEQGKPNTLGALCVDGTLGAWQQTESVESIRVAADAGSLAPGAAATVTVRYWAAVANEADQVDVYLAANALDPAWMFLGTLTPTVVGLNESQIATTLPTGPLQAIRANFRFAQPGPSTCSTGDYGDRDDLVFTVGSPSDTTAPIVSLDAPVAGGVLGADFPLTATVTDDQGIAKVEFLVDGAVSSTVLLPDPGISTQYSTVWPTWMAPDGAHDLSVRAHDTSGNVTTTAVVAVTVDNLPNAVFDAAWHVPVCADVASFCDSAALLDGRGTVWPEADAPNTLWSIYMDGSVASWGACADGDDGVYHQDESLDWIRVSSVDGLPLEAGKRARVEAKVWSWLAWGDDALDLYYTSSPGHPHWIWFATLHPAGPGAEVLSAEYVIPPGGMQAVRGRYRFGGAEGPCGTGPYDDHDDVLFAVQYTPNAVYDATLKVPSCSGAGSYCDSGALLDGRDALGPEPHAPNTLKSTCVDGNVGVYHVEPSVDAIVVRTEDLSQLKAGQIARVELSVYASASFADERIDLFTCANPSAAPPVWTWAATVYPALEGAQVLLASIPVTAGTQAVRAHLLRDSGATPAPAVACGITDDPAVADDHDDLVFTAAE